MIHRFDFVVVDVDAKVPLADRQAYAAAQQRQLREHIAPAWQGDTAMAVRAATPEAPPQAGEVQIRLIGVAPKDQQGALGFHDALPDGTPVIYVFLDLATLYGDPWTSIASHEVCEVVGDPRLRLAVEMADGSFWDREIADRVEADTYYIDDVPLSNFNYPEAFEPPQDTAGVQYDQCNLSKRPNEVRPGGYAQKFDPKQGWTQVGEMRGYRAHVAKLGLSRNMRRRTRYLRLSWWQRLLARFGRAPSAS